MVIRLRYTRTFPTLLCNIAKISTPTWAPPGREIPYRRKFPLCLMPGSVGRTTQLQVFEDISSFCESLDLPVMELPDWDSNFHFPTQFLAEQRKVQRQDISQDISQDIASLFPTHRLHPSKNRHSPGEDSVPASSTHHRVRIEWWSSLLEQLIGFFTETLLRWCL